MGGAGINIFIPEDAETVKLNARLRARKESDQDEKEEEKEKEKERDEKPRCEALPSRPCEPPLT
jgi:hypothetical protein